MGKLILQAATVLGFIILNKLQKKACFFILLFAGLKNFSIFALPNLIE
jgi:hypothetical protein